MTNPSTRFGTGMGLVWMVIFGSIGMSAVMAAVKFAGHMGGWW